MKHLLLTFAFISCSIDLSSQNNKIDSLRIALSKCKEDTNRVNTLNALGLELSFIKPDSAMQLCVKAIKLSQELKWSKGEANAERVAGWVCFLKNELSLALEHFNKVVAICDNLLRSKDEATSRAGKVIKGRVLGNIASIYKAETKYEEAIDSYSKGLKLLEEVGDRVGIGKTYGNIALVYQEQSDYPRAQEYFFKALGMAEEFGDKRQVGSTLTNIASIYFYQADHQKAIEYALKGLKICEETGDIMAIKSIYTNLAGIYRVKREYTLAMDYCNKALKLAEETRDGKILGMILGTKANIYDDQGEFSKAIECHQRSLKVAEESGNKYGQSITYSNMGNVKMKMKLFGEAETLMKKGLALSKEIASLDLERFHEQSLSILYRKTNQPALALEHYQKFIELRDSIYNKENSKKLLRAELNHDFEKKEAIARAEHAKELEKQEALSEERHQRQNIIIASVGIGLLMVTVFLGFIFRSLRLVKKQKGVIERQKAQVEQKQKEIIDSIYYAQRIQKALITPEKYIDKSLNKLLNK